MAFLRVVYYYFGNFANGFKDEKTIFTPIWLLFGAVAIAFGLSAFGHTLIDMYKTLFSSGFMSFLKLF